MCQGAKSLLGVRLKFLKYFLAVQIFTLVSEAGSSYIQPPTPPVYETCGTVQDWNGNQIPEPACTSRNNQKKRDYDYAVNSYNRAQNMINNDSTGANKPTEPKYETCDFQDYSCQMRNSKLRTEYDRQMQAYTITQNEQEAARQQQTAEQQRMATVNNVTTTGLLNEIENKNKDAQGTYQMAAQACGVVSQVFSAKFAASCSGGLTCQYQYLAGAVAFNMLQGIGGRQAGEHAASGLSACNSFNSVSSSQKDCTPTQVITDPQAIMNNFDSNGKCTGDPKACQAVLDGLNGTGFTPKQAKDIVTKGGKQPFKVNPDGSVTTPDGKTYSAKDFASEEAMRAAGLSAGDAKTLAGLLKGSPLAAASADLEKMNADAKLKESSLNAGFGSNGSGSSSDSRTLGSDGLNKLGNKDDGKNRKPATAGLVKNFNGESIGVAGEDIFVMMNRRYKLKVSQDSFIGQ